MSASTGLLAKGEKGKSKFQSLDINNLYKSTENEPAQAKNSLFRTKNGMQSLGKVPTARRPPANLPSLKSESSGNEPAVSLVPAGAAGWGSKPGETPPPHPHPHPHPSHQQPNTTAPLTGPPPAAVTPVPVVVAPVVLVPPPHEQALHNLMPGPDKSWSAMMLREQVPQVPNFLAHQSPQFQNEFPLLASDGGPAAPANATAVDAQYGPGPSLRPQTEGSWIAGGGRPLSGVAGGGPVPSPGPVPHAAGPEPGAVRTPLGPHPPAPAPMGPAGPPGPHSVVPPTMPINYTHTPAYRPLQHPFMMGPRPGYPGGSIAGMRPRFPYPPGGPGGPVGPGGPGGRMPDLAQGDELVTRPIIRDEELNKMDEMARDPGWAANEDIDYNEKLAFSDSEDGPLGDSKKRDSKDARKDKSRGRDDDKERGEREMERRSEDRHVDKRNDWGRSRGTPGPSEEERRKLRDAEDERRKLREMEEERRKLGMEEERRKMRDMEEERRKLRESEEDRRKVREEVAAACQVARQRKEDESKRFDEAKRGERRNWAEEIQKRDMARERDMPRERDMNRETKRDGDRDGKRDDRGRYDRDTKADNKWEENKRDSDHGKYEKQDEPKYERDAKRDDGKRDDHGKREPKRESDHVTYDREQKRDDHGKFDRDQKRDEHNKFNRDQKRDDHGKFDRDGKSDWAEQIPKRDVARERDMDRENKRDGDRDGKRDGKYERDAKREGDHGKFDRDQKRDDHRDRDYRGGRMDDRRDYRQPPRQFAKLPPRLQAQAERLNSQRQTSSPQPAGVNSSYDQHWGHGRRYGGDSGEETRDRHTPDTYSDRFKSGQRDRHGYQEPDTRRHFDRKDRESDTERHSDDSYKKPRDDLPSRGVKDVKKEASEEREARRGEEERRPQRPDSRDSRASRDSRNSREDKQEMEEDRRREDVVAKVPTPVPREESTPPRDNKDPTIVEVMTSTISKDQSPPKNVIALSDATHSSLPPAVEKESKEEKSPGQDESRQKGNRPTRGGRWGSAPTSSSTYVRNGNRGERRRRVSGSKPEHESGSSGEGGSELDKGEKDERNRETRRTSEGRDGFAPSGQPSRRGRGTARVRGGSGAPRRMDGYGPPPVKASFLQNEQPAVEEEEEDPTKQKQAALNAGIVGGAARAAAAGVKPDGKPAPPRMQRSQSQRDGTRGKPGRGGARRSGGRSGTEGDDWDVVSNSDGEDGKGELGSRARRSGPGGRGNPRSSGHRTSQGPGSGFGPNRSAPTTDNKEEKSSPDAAKPKSVEGDADSSHSSTNVQDGRAKKDFARKDGIKSGGKPDSIAPRGGAGGKDRDRLDRPDRSDRNDRRGKPMSLPTPPVAPNPNGPQPLMSQVVNPPPQLTGKNYSSNTWRQVPVLPPRLQKQQDQRQQANADSHDLSKMNSTAFPPKTESVLPRENAWDKPLGPRSVAPPISDETGAADASTVTARSSPAATASTPTAAPPVPAGKRADPLPLLDDSAPPVNTIIFENTNLKTGAPGSFSAGLKSAPVRVTKGNEWKAGEELFGKGGELGGEQGGAKPQQPQTVPPQPQQPQPQPSLYHTVHSEHGLDLLNSQLSEMTEENAADLKHRLAGTKTLWDQNEDEEQGSAVFPAPFCQDTTMDGFGKAVEGVVVADDQMAGLMHPGDVVYSPVSQAYNMSKHDPSNSSNVCKVEQVKPQQQLSSGHTGHSPLAHTSQSPLSPPPFSSAQPQFNYQQGLGGNGAQFSGMSAIPSPPSGHPYSSQPLQASSGLFTPFQLERSQFSTQFSAPYGLSAAGLGSASSFNQPPLYLPHAAHAAPPSDIFSQFRVQHPSAHTNPNTVLMTSTANSLMSASVKPSSQNIGVIGSKAPTFQQSNQMFIPYDAMQLGLSQSYLSGSGLVQRSAPVQQAAPNFYSNSAAAQTGFYSTPNAGLGQPMQSLQQQYNRQGYVSQSTNLQNYSSQPQVHMDMGYRNAGAVGPGSYLKSGVGNSASVTQPDVLASVFNSAPPKARPQKQMGQPPPQQSPTQANVNKFGNYANASQLMPQYAYDMVMQGAAQQQVGPQRMSGPQNNTGLGGVRAAPRYPTPIQRPMGYRGSRPGAPQHQRQGKPYYDSQDGKLDEVSDLSAVEESSTLNCEAKLSDAPQSSNSESPEETTATPAE